MSRRVVPLLALALLISGCSGIRRINLTDKGEEGRFDGVTEPVAIDDRGNVAFVTADYLTSTDHEGVSDVYTWDRAPGSVALASVTPDGAQDGVGSRNPAISGDGRFVAFTTSTGGPLPQPPDAVGTYLYVHDRRTGALERVVITGESGYSTGDAAVLDADGSRLALHWSKDGYDGVWLIDRTTDTASPVWVDSVDDPPAIAVPTAMSDDGTLVSFTARGNEDGPTGESVDRHVYVTDTTTGATRSASVDEAGAALPGSWLGRVSGDGSAVVLAMDGAPYHVYRKDLETGVLQPVAVGHCEAVAGSATYTLPSISDDGDVIAFSSDSPDLVAGDTNGKSDVFIWRAGRPCTVELLSRGLRGKPSDNESYWPEVSGNGRVLAFVSDATNLVGDDTNGRADAFVVPVGRRGRL